tara:strand:+ start:1445 stop:2017 length:573 start_codon:yes stop_codon:yes gene_type:complete
MSKSKKTVYLIRGFPGCGKTRYIKDNFKNQKITLFENYDLKNNEYENLYLEKERNFIDLFKSMNNNKLYFSHSILITGFFPNKISISNIKYLCDVFHYKFNVVTFDNVCDKDETKYLFNRSSIKKFNKSYIFKNIHNYEDTLIVSDDENDYDESFEANFNDCPGDSLSCGKSKEELDFELDEIKRNHIEQ